jgi:hypothetical protein
MVMDGPGNLHEGGGGVADCVNTGAVFLRDLELHLYER